MEKGTKADVLGLKTNIPSTQMCKYWYYNSDSANKCFTIYSLHKKMKV